MNITKAQQFCEALEAVAHLSPEASREVEQRFAPARKRNKEEGRLYFNFEDGSFCYFDIKKGVISLPAYAFVVC